MLNFFKKNKEQPEILDYSSVIGAARPFATAEAHKRLRTNIMFSFAQESDSRVIGVTSSMAHEGKSTTSINLAYDLMKAGKKVLLIDADMRMSNFEKVLGIKKSPGLSNLLVAREDNTKYFQSSPELEGLNVIACGDFPPNPSELLSSNRMATVIDSLRKMFDYIVIDLPPIAAVTDALVVAKLTDGIVVVVRQDYADKRLMDDTVRQLQHNHANIIGFVMNCSKTENKYYGKNGGRYGTYEYGQKTEEVSSNAK